MVEVYMATKNKTALIRMVNEVCCDECKNNDSASQKIQRYCLLKEIIICSHQDPRFLAQLKCLEKFKWEESEKEGKDIGWDEAHIRWVSQGYAKKFADLYSEDMNPKDLYTKIKEIK